MLFKPLALLAILAGSVVAGPVELFRRDRRIIGYRRVSKAQAEDYKNHGNTLTYDPQKATGGSQIGKGVYTSPKRGAWPIGNAGDWWCVIRADGEAIDNLGKVWVPEFYMEFDNLWFVSDDIIEKYIKTVDDGLNPKKSLRFARINGDREALQMMIPPGLLNGNGGGLGITVECYEDVNKLPTNEVNYDDFEPSGDKDPEF